MAVKKTLNEVAIIEKELNPMLEQARTLVIKSSSDMKKATEYLSQLNLAKDKVTDRMETITKPAKQTIKAAEAVWKPFITAAKEAIELIRENMSEYQTEQTRLAREEEEKIASRVGQGKGKLKYETAVQQIENVDKPVDKVMTESGSVKFREDEVFEVIDITLLPVEYILPNEVKIRAAMKDGKKLPGVAYSTKQVPINTR
jgi:hypothetical protein